MLTAFDIKHSHHFLIYRIWCNTQSGSYSKVFWVGDKCARLHNYAQIIIKDTEKWRNCICASRTRLTAEMEINGVQYRPAQRFIRLKRTAKQSDLFISSVSVIRNNRDVRIEAIGLELIDVRSYAATQTVKIKCIHLVRIDFVPLVSISFWCFYGCRLYEIGIFHNCVHFRLRSPINNCVFEIGQSNCNALCIVAALLWLFTSHLMESNRINSLASFSFDQTNSNIYIIASLHANTFTM